MFKLLLFAHSIPGHSRPTDPALHDMAGLGHTHTAHRPSHETGDWANLVLTHVWRGVVGRFCGATIVVSTSSVTFLLMLLGAYALSFTCSLAG